MQRAGFRCLGRRWPRLVVPRAPRQVRSISYGAGHMTGPLEHVEPPLPSSHPTDSFHLLAEKDKAGEAEDAIYNEQIKQVKDWWASPRYQGIKRPYSADDVVSKRGTLQQVYPSSLMARKLFNLFEARAAKGEPVHTSVLASSNYIAGRIKADFLPFSGRHRSRPNDTTSPKPGSAVHLWLGVLVCTHYYERSLS